MVKTLLGIDPLNSTVAGDPKVIKANARYRAALLIILFLGTLVAVGCLVVISIGVLRLNAVNDAAAEQRALILSCTTPGGSCYEDAQARTAKVVKQIVKSDQQISDHNAERILHAIRTIFPVAKSSH